MPKMLTFATLFLIAVIAGFLIAGCTSDGPTRVGGTDDAPRIVAEVDLPLQEAAPSQASSPTRKAFEARPFRGWLDETGAWALRAEVHHPRLRCATYETGIRFGVGDASCANARWLSNTTYGTRQTQCNGATRVHANEGQLDPPLTALGAVNCVRVLVRCFGAC